MPFDGIGFAFDDRVRKMDQVINLLATPEKWCKAQFKTPDGRYCIRGAMMAVEGTELLKPVVLRAIHEVTGKRYRRIEAFNDHPYTQHTEVLRVLARARHLVASGKSAAKAAPATEAGGWYTLWKALLTSISRARVYCD